MQTNASQYGLGAALVQNDQPITFASKILTGVGICYANIEWECLSVCFCLEKFHAYINSGHITIQNDHKLQEMMQHKPIHAAPSPHLQCILLNMRK